jgi:ribose 5-phosphate isomerase A
MTRNGNTDSIIEFKGGGACQFQEMVVAKAAKKFVMIAGKLSMKFTLQAFKLHTYRKKSSKLGTQWTKGVPIEVVPLAYKVVINALKSELSIKPETITLRMVCTTGFLVIFSIVMLI